MSDDGQRVLTVRQIAEHLGTAAWNITRELQLGALGQPGRLRGSKVFGRAGTRGRGGQWRVSLADYLDWLNVPDEDRGQKDLPRLRDEREVGQVLHLTTEEVRDVLRRSALNPVTVGQRRYLTDSQFRLLLDKEPATGLPGPPR